MLTLNSRGEVTDSEAEIVERTAVVRISAELLVELLHLPPETRIMAIESEFAISTAGNVDLLLRVNHPDLTPVPFGSPPPSACPQFAAQPPVRFVGWGQS